MSGIPWERRVQYAGGFLQLGMSAEAEEELSLVEPKDRERPEILAAFCDLYSLTKDWRAMADTGRALAGACANDPHGWISWAFALRELQQVEAARDVLLEAESCHRTCGVLHYNLACYHSLLGDLEEAKRRFRAALEIDRSWKDAGLEDSDLTALHGFIGTL